MVLSLYLSRESSDFDEIWSVDSNFGSTNGHLLIYKKIIKFIMADSRHIENRLSAISPRFIVRLTQNFVWISRITFIHRSHDQNTKFAKIADDRHCENGFITIPQPGIIRFRWNLVCRLKFWFKDRSHAIYKNMTFKMADSRYIENRLLATSARVIVRFTRYLVCASRTMLWQTPRDESSNFRKFKMADGRHFENGFITIS